jgi:hypothetical protein
LVRHMVFQKLQYKSTELIRFIEGNIVPST